MFLESLLETSTQAKSRRGWATLVSFLLETSVLGVLILVPLLYTDALPAAVHWVDNAIAMPTSGPPPDSTPAGDNTIRKPVPETNADRTFRAPDLDAVPDHPYIPTEPETPPPAIGSNTPYIPGAIPGGGNGGNPIIDNMLRSLTMNRPAVEPPPTAPVVISHVDEARLIYRVQPQYPEIARIGRIEGPVVLHAIIARDGTIRAAEIVSGHPVLARAALDAVRQWRYRPFHLGGHPVEVDTQITVNFILSR